MNGYSLFTDKRIVNHGEALYILSLSHIGKSIIDGVEATGTDVLCGEVYEAPFLCGAVLTKHYDAVGTIATVYFDIHKLTYQFKIINKHIRVVYPSAFAGNAVDKGGVGFLRCAKRGVGNTVIPIRRTFKSYVSSPPETFI